MLRTVIRAGAVLDLFTAEEPEWGVSATATRLGIANSMAHELLVSLASIGLLQRVGHGRYRLGWRAVSLASVLLRTSDLKVRAAPVVQRLAEGTRSGVRLVAWDRGAVVCIERRQTRARPNGTGAAADWGAAARVLLASRPTEEVEALWERGAIPTGHASLDALEDELDRICTQGWASGPGDDPRQGSVAAPVRDPRGAVVAALELDLPDPGQPTDPRFHIRTVVAAASLITASLRDEDAAARGPLRPAADMPLDPPAPDVAHPMAARAARRHP